MAVNQHARDSEVRGIMQDMFNINTVETNGEGAPARPLRTKGEKMEKKVYMSEKGYIVFIQDLDYGEVIKRLKKGEFMHNEKGDTIFMVNGVICKECDTDFIIGASFSIWDSYYFEGVDPSEDVSDTENVANNVTDC